MRDSTRARRQQVILELVRTGRARTQADIADGLFRARMTVTQATISRDVRELNLVRAADGSYAAPDDTPDRLSPPRQAVLRDYIADVIRVQFLMVVRTSPGSAPLVARAIDQGDWNDVAGTVAGDDTVVVICRDNRAAERVEPMLGLSHG